MEWDPFSCQSSMPVAAADNNHENGSRRWRASPAVIGAESPCGDLRDSGVIRVAPHPWIPDQVRNDERGLAKKNRPFPRTHCRFLLPSSNDQSESRTG